MLVPKIVTALKDYNREKFLGDLVAGLIVGVVALPLAIAFAIASGGTPDRGLWTAIVAGFLISLLGGSMVQIGGPTGAFVVIVYGIVQKYGIDGLTVATLMAGVILIGMGIAKLGTMIKFIPYPVVTGFMSGIAVIIFSGEIKDLFGLQMGAVPADFIGKWLAYARTATGFTPDAMVVSFIALAIILAWPKVNRRIPGPFVALIVTTLLVKVMHLPVETAISVGMVLAAFLFMKRMAEVTNVRAVTQEFEEDDADRSGSDENGGRLRDIPPGVEIYEINGAFFFGAAETFKSTLALVARKPKVLIIRMRNVLLLDSTGMHALKDVVHRSRKDGTAVLLSDVHMQPLVALTGSTVLEEIGSENVFSDLDEALQRARELLSSPPTPRRIDALAS